MVDASTPLVPLGPLVGRLQVARVIDLVYQTEPLASFDPSFEGRQHAIRPDMRFHPGPTAPDFSGLFSPSRHWRAVAFRRSGLHASTFLSPFAPRPLRRFSALMGTLTPRRVSYSTEASPLHVTRPLRPFCIQPPHAPPSTLSHATPQLDGSPLRVQTSPLASRLAGT